jgi:hypothetical protein
MRYVQLRWQDDESDRIRTRCFGEASGRSNGPFERKIRSLLKDDGFGGGKGREHRREDRGNG